ncbi:uncharacterized protein [Watersipora subatra]|uniref:uncharacterized protein n=1 Tax=Watersipora subatra TaxID=2589382 RepID=UPI00355B7E4B
MPRRICLLVTWLLGTSVCCFPTFTENNNKRLEEYKMLIKTPEGRVEMLRRYNEHITAKTKKDFQPVRELCIAFCQYCYPEEVIVEIADTHPFDLLNHSEFVSWEDLTLDDNRNVTCASSCFLRGEPLYPEEPFGNCQLCLKGEREC